MRLLRIRRKKPQSKSPKASPPPSDDSRGPKNGWLTLAVAASILLMIVLTALNVRYISDPSISIKAFGHPMQHGRETGNAAERSPTSPQNKRPDAPPELTFYTRLTVPEDLSAPKYDAGQVTEKHIGPDSHDLRAENGAHLRKGSQTASSAVASAQTADKSALHTDDQPDLPNSRDRAKRYAVQVGAFSTPAIARQWASVWKERGYDVSLKPVARPNAGVIYRLYLGSFSSEKQADQLVKRLTTREGINAFLVALLQLARFDVRHSYAGPH